MHWSNLECFAKLFFEVSRCILHRRRCGRLSSPCSRSHYKDRPAARPKICSDRIGYMLCPQLQGRQFCHLHSEFANLAPIGWYQYLSGQQPRLLMTLQNSATSTSTLILRTIVIGIGHITQSRRQESTLVSISYAMRWMILTEVPLGVP